MLGAAMLELLNRLPPPAPDSPQLALRRFHSLKAPLRFTSTRGAGEAAQVALRNARLLEAVGEGRLRLRPAS